MILRTHFTYQIRFFFILLSVTLLLLTCTNSELEIIPEFTISNTGPYIMDNDLLNMVKENLDHPDFLVEYERLLSGADKILNKNDFQFVTDKKHIPPSGDIHDYMSIARYLWPDPSTGAFTETRDGQTNPLIYEYDRPKLSSISSSIYTLSLAYYFSENEEYAKKASELITGWFLDRNTRMNPNLNYAQVALGVNNNSGSHQGIIDSNDFIKIIEGVSLIYDSNHWNSEDHKQLKKWFYLFSNWITSKYNPDYSCKEYACTNVSTWFDAQKTIYFLFTEQADRLNSSSSIQPIREKISNQFTEMGVQQAERTRALSQHYFYFNLRGYMKIALLRKNKTGYDRDWQTFQSANYGGIKPSLDALADYLNGEDVSLFFDVSDDFDDCRYLEIFKPAVVAFENELYNNAAHQLTSSGCSNPDILLPFPYLHWIVN